MVSLSGESSRYPSAYSAENTTDTRVTTNEYELTMSKTAQNIGSNCALLIEEKTHESSQPYNKVQNRGVCDKHRIMSTCLSVLVVLLTTVAVGSMVMLTLGGHIGSKPPLNNTKEPDVITYQLAVDTTVKDSKNLFWKEGNVPVENREIFVRRSGIYVINLSLSLVSYSKQLEPSIVCIHINSVDNERCIRVHLKEDSAIPVNIQEVCRLDSLDKFWVSISNVDILYRSSSLNTITVLKL